MKLRFSRAAEDELHEAAVYLEKQQPGLGQRFLNEIETTRRRILENPQAWHPLGVRLRRCHLKRFRYALIYRTSSSVIEIVAVAHDRRMPNYWRKR